MQLRLLDSVFQDRLNNNIKLDKLEVVEDSASRVKIESFLNNLKPSIFQRVLSKLKRAIK